MGSTPYNFFSLSLQERREGESPPPNLSRQLGWFKRDHGTYPDVGSIPTRGPRAQAHRHLVLLKNRAGETRFHSPAHPCQRSLISKARGTSRPVYAGAIPVGGPLLKVQMSLWDIYA